MTGISDELNSYIDTDKNRRSASSREKMTSAKRPSSISIRPLCADDINQIARICFPEDDFDTIVDRLQDELKTQQAGDSVTLVAECGGCIWGTLKLDSHGRTGWIHNMAVAPSMRGKGLAGMLIEAAISEAELRGFQRISLHVRSSNSSAIRAYKKAGFHFASVDGMRGEQLRYSKVLKLANE